MSYTSSSTTDDYRYQPLDHATQQIRLVTLLDPLENDDAGSFDISIFEMADAPPYTALSYVWGPPTSQNDIYIANGKLVIRENLIKFLVEFRERSDKAPSDRYLWIDQLCIDQSTTSERNHQVQMMIDIYSGAESVIVWLGDGSKKLDSEHEHLDIRTVLANYSWNECVDPRDKVYGLLGLVHLEQRVVVDYDRSNEQVFLDIVSVVNESHCLKGLEVADPPVDNLIVIVTDLTEDMGIEFSYRESISFFLSEIWEPDGLKRFFGHTCPITAMGFEEPAVAGFKIDRWWFDFQGKRYFIGCSFEEALATVTTTSVLPGDWDNLFPKKHAYKTS